jgi:cell division protease FtsH
VHKISIVPRGVAALGYTQQLPEEDRYLLQKRELEARVAVLLGGRAAEEVVYGEISSGAGNDIERVTDLARRMVAELGMSEALGPIAFHRRQALFLQSAAGEGGGGDFSEATARLIDSEVHRIVMEGYERAREILVRDRAALELIAQRLLEQEVIERDELRLLLGEPPIPPADTDRGIGPTARAGAAAASVDRGHG